MLLIFPDALLVLVRKAYNESRSVSTHYERHDNQIEELHKTVSLIHAGTISMKKAAMACFPWQRFEEIENFAMRRDMIPLRLRITSVPFRSIKHYATDLLLALFGKKLIAYTLTWPSPQ